MVVLAATDAGSVRLEGRGTVRFLFFVLVGQLLGHGAALIVDLALDSEADHAGNNNGDREGGNGSAPDLSLQPAIEERHEKKCRRHQAGNDDHADHDSRALPST